MAFFLFFLYNNFILLLIMMPTLKKNISSPDTLPSSPEFDSSLTFDDLQFDQEGEKEKLISNIMEWFEENGVKPGNPDDILGQYCQLKR